MPKQRAAFFDVDNTLLNLKSMFSFQQFYYDYEAEFNATSSRYPEFVNTLHTHPQRDDRLVLNRLFYQSFAGRRRSMLASLAETWFENLLQTHGGALWIRSALELAETLRAESYRLVAVSGSCHEILAPLLRHLRFDDCLATELEVDGDSYTGRIAGIQMIGEGKAEAMRRYAAQNDMEVGACAACGDHITDLPMLQQAGARWVVAGDPALEQLALERGWPILSNVAMPLEQLMHV